MKGDRSVESALRERARRVRLVAFDFDGVFTDNTVVVFEDGREAVRCWRGDGIGLRKLDRLGLSVVILSTEPNPVVGARAKKLGVRCVQGLSEKLDALRAIARESGIGLDSIAYLGNDVNDRECLQAVGLPMVVADAHEDVVALAAHRTVSRGGRGAVREVCDLFERLLGDGA